MDDSAQIRSVMRARRLLKVAAGLAIFIGLAFVIDSDRGRDIAAAISAQLHGYHGCMCEDCRQEILGVWDSRGSVVTAAVFVELPVAIPLELAHGLFYPATSDARSRDPWIVGRNMLLLSVLLLALGLFGQRPLMFIARKLARNPDRCTGCKYDLRGLTTDAACPECGRRRGR